MFDIVPIILAATDTVPADFNPVSAFYQQLLHNGLMGGAVALLIFLLIKRDRDLQNSQEGRLNDTKAVAELIKNHTAAIVASNASNEERTRALEVSSRAAEKNIVLLDQLVKVIEELKTIIMKGDK